MENNQLKKAAASLAVAGAMLGGVAAYASAQDGTATAEPNVVEPTETTTPSTTSPSTTSPEASTTEPSPAQSDGDRGGAGRGGEMRGGAEIADLLGITSDELRTAIQAGQSLAEIAEANGVDVDDVIDDLVAEHNDRIDQAVADGHITETQATELRSQVVDHVTARVNGEQAVPLEGLGPDGGRGRGGDGGMRGGGMRGGAEIADLLGVTTDELRTAMQEGQSLAEVAEANGVDVDTVIDALVAEHNDRIDQAVADGRITEAEATELRNQVVDHVTAEVNGEDPGPIDGLGRDGMGRGGPRGSHADDGSDDGTDSGTDTDAATNLTSGQTQDV